MQQYDEAIIALKSASNYYIELDEKTGLCTSKLKLASALNYSGKSVQAMQLAKESLAAAQDFQNPSLESRCYETMAEMANHNKQYKKAYEWTLLYKALDDSLALANKEEILQELETKYQVERKNNKIVLLESNNRLQQKNILILSISIGALVAILLLAVILFRMKHLSVARQRKVFEQEKIIRRQAEEIIHKEKQLLQDQLETQSRELATKALEMLRVNETISTVLNKLESLIQVHNSQPEIATHIKSIVLNLKTKPIIIPGKSLTRYLKIFIPSFMKTCLTNAPASLQRKLKLRPC